ncbi:MAG: hypothetical protein DRJ45_08180 [Thermoprotei archaeon]|nr:MAG: hypothetical protein DRJ45_08180 [Thermoprotei archaeon]
MKTYSDVSVVIGSRNEEEAIRKVITDIQKATNNQAEIVVVDGSIDRTPEIAEELDAKVIRQKPQGYGIAVKKALLSASLELAKLVNKLTNSFSEMKFHPLPKDDPPRRKPDITKAKKILNWKPKVELKKGLSKMMKWFKEKESEC